jgi:PAS domain S-box-containing protein
MSDIQWEELAGTLFEEAGDALFLFDPDTEEVCEVNPMAQRLSGFTRRELLGMKVTYLIRSEADGGLQRLRQAFRRTGLFHSQEGFWLRNRRGGAWVPVNLTLTRLHTEPKTLGLITARDITEHREGHARLREAEAELRRVLTSISDALWSAEIDVSGKFTYRLVSPVVEKILGRKPEYFQSPANWLDILHPDDRPRMEAAHKELKTGTGAQLEYRILTPEGDVRWVRDSVTCRGGPGSYPIRLDGVLTDITERKRAEEAAHEAATRNRVILEQLPAIVWTTDSNLNFTSGMGAGLQHIPPSQNPPPVNNIRDLFGEPEPNETPIAAHLRAIEGEAVTYDLSWAGRNWHSHVEPLRNPAGETIGVIGIALDNTERIRAEEARRASETTSRNLIENLSQSIFLKDSDLRFRLVNKPFCEGLGLPEYDIIDRNDYDFFPTHLADKYRADDIEVLRTGRRLETEEQCLLQGKVRTVCTVKTPVRDETNKVIGVLGVFWDITDQRNLEAQLRQAHKMEAVGQLAGGIAHDFNNLLTGILGNLSLALADLPTTHPSHELLANAEVAALRAAELTRQMLGFSRRTPLLPRPVDLNACIDETVRLLRRTFDPRLSVLTRCPRDLWPVRADPGQMSQVLMNLCLNARDAMPEGGQLVLETANVTLDAMQLARSLDGRPGDYVRLRVSDTGCGMTAEVRERIFEPFFTTKEPGKGTGLGLAMVFGIIKVHSGWIDCRSENGQGTTFEIFLPRLMSVPIVEIPVVVAPPPAPNGGHETILLADDEDVVNRLGQAILERQGYRVFNAADGAEAVAIYRQRPSEIDLVILDLAMPRLSGPETLKELRKLNPAVQVLISSGYSSEEDMRAVEREGVVGFVAKPYRPAELARQVRLALDRSRAVSKQPG